MSYNHTSSLITALQELANSGQDKHYILNSIISHIDENNPITDELNNYCSALQKKAAKLETSRMFPEYKPYPLERKIKAVLDAVNDIKSSMATKTCSM